MLVERGRCPGHPGEGAQLHVAEPVCEGACLSRRLVALVLMPVRARHERSRTSRALRLGERTRIEDEAPRFLKPRTYLEPFALRALGIVRQDPALIDQALERFAALGLAWHAAQTGALAQGV